MSNPGGPRIHVGGKTFDSFDDLPPETRKKLEQALEQMRASGALEDKNRDGIPDRFETSLKVAGWFGKLTGNPQLKSRLEAQLRALGGKPAPAPPPKGGAHERALSARVTRTATPPPVPAHTREEPREESARAEFLRKLVIVSVLVGLGYLGFRLLG